MVCGLLGRKLGHSYSPQIHAHFGNYTYQLFEKEPEDVAYFLRSNSFHGINVTIPYKKFAAQNCDRLTPIAKRLGSVNTVVRMEDGTLLGHNTDYFGFKSMVERTGLNLTGKKVLILGSGGASVTVQAVLEDIHALPVVISRSGENNYANLDRHSDASAIVNATPVGMYPETQAQPIDLLIFKNLEGVFDLIYNPAHTRLLQAAEERNIKAANGLWMLVAQAKESAELFLDQKIPDELINKIHKTLQFQMENIVLIGMPGCGKSTVGKMIAAHLGRPFIDTDEEIVRVAGRSIPEIFANKGESAFRKLETDVIADISKKSGFIIATGGGCVTQKRNYSHLHQNSKIIWLQRELSSLPTDGRPLSMQNKLEDLYKQRKPMYQNFADIIIVNDEDPETVAKKIINSVMEDI